MTDTEHLLAKVGAARSSVIGCMAALAVMVDCAPPPLHTRILFDD